MEDYVSEQPFIIFEDQNILAINKPSGYLSHPVKKQDNRPSITGWLAQKYPNLANVGKFENRFAIVHRLDRDTSGVILAAKNQMTFENLQKQFQERKIKKEYIALVEGKIFKKGIITAPLTAIKNKKSFSIKALNSYFASNIQQLNKNHKKKIQINFRKLEKPEPNF